MLERQQKTEEELKAHLDMYWLEKGKRLRRCGVCGDKIPNADKHMIFRHATRQGWPCRLNICVFCIDIAAKQLKKGTPWRKRLKQRMLDLVLSRI